MSAIRLHIPAIPFTITHNDYSHCAFTGKVLRFAPMMRSRGFEVYHYGAEGSESGATKDIQLMTKAEWTDLRIKSYQMLHPAVSYEESKRILDDPTTFYAELAHWETPIWKVFNARLVLELRKHYRSKGTDIFCMPLFRYEAIDKVDMFVVESGIGYGNSESAFRIFESYAWMHLHLTKGQGKNYWFVVPNYFNIAQWPLSLTPATTDVGFFGRMTEGKGIYEIPAVAKRFPHIRFIICGQGDPSPYLGEPNIFYKPPIHGEGRAEYLGSLTALLAPSMFPEPFCGVAVEAQLCGTPVMTKDYGAQTETVENFKTGLRCHTVADYCYGIQMALDGKFDRAYIRERAVHLYDMYQVGKQYEYAFKTLMDITNGNNGWYSPTSHIASLL